MDNQDQGRTRTRIPGLKGDDDHGVHACHSGSSGAVEGSNPSDKEHLSDNDSHSLGSAPSSGSMEPLQNSLSSANDVETVTDDVKVTDDDQMQDPSILQGEKPDSHVETLHKSTNDVQVESARGTQFPTSGDDNTSQEMEEGNVNVFTGPVCENRAGDEDNSALTNQSQLNEEREVLSPDETLSRKSWDLVDEESTEGSSDNEIYELSDEPGGFMYDLTSNIDSNYMDPFSKKRVSYDAGESSQQITLPTTETSGGIRLDNNEYADKSTPSGAQDNEMSTSSRANKECDDTPSVENLSGNSDVLPPSSVPHTCNDNGINRGSLDGNQGSNSGTIEVIEIFAEMTDSDDIILHSPVHSFIPMENANRINEPESSANEAVRVEGGNSPTVADSQNGTVRRGFNWASCLCCCLWGDR
ncbi:hypothetical protein V8G54_019107 [Vigna mungo]|uniref:Uncharacterized protein n=1 Tax=Vigna mungo TaxID=3915 RepID=A0AAQ3RVC5_VIGMU